MAKIFFTFWAAVTLGLTPVSAYMADIGVSQVVSPESPAPTPQENQGGGGLVLPVTVIEIGETSAAGGLAITNISATSYNLSWRTSAPSRCTVYWGRTSGYELGVSGEVGLRNSHEITLADFTDPKGYYLRLMCAGQDGGFTALADYHLTPAEPPTPAPIPTFVDSPMAPPAAPQSPNNFVPKATLPQTPPSLLVPDVLAQERPELESPPAYSPGAEGPGTDLSPPAPPIVVDDFPAAPLAPVVAPFFPGALVLFLTLLLGAIWILFL